MAIKDKDLMEIRNQALNYALKIAENYGVEGLRDEISRRQIMKYSLLAPDKEIQKIKVEITERTVDIVTSITLDTLMEKFNFDKDMANIFYSEFNKMVAVILTDTEDNLENLTERVANKTGIKVNIRKGIGE